MSIGIVATAQGSAYRAFVPEWLEAVTALQRAPEMIVISTDHMGEVAQMTEAYSAPIYIVPTKTQWQHHPQVAVNDAIEICDTTWICKMDIDDLVQPHALNNLDMSNADVYMFGMELRGNSMYANEVNGYAVYHAPHNLVFSGSPFKRWVWEASPYLDMVYEDWAFWRNAARNGAQFEASKTIDYTYRLHGNNVSTRCDDHYWTSVVKQVS